MRKLEYTFKTDTLFKMPFVQYPELLKKLVADLLGIPLQSIGQFVIRNPEMPPENLVQCFLIPHTLSTCYFRHRRVVFSQQCHRIVSFLRLVMTKISSTKYMGIKETLY